MAELNLGSRPISLKRLDRPDTTGFDVACKWANMGGSRTSAEKVGALGPWLRLLSIVVQASHVKCVSH
jgi:hypothetical protein